MSTQSEPASTPSRPRWIPWAVAAAIVLVGVLIFALTSGGDDGGDKAPAAPAVKVGVPTILSGAQLRAFGRAQAVPVYWAGPQAGRRYELTRTAKGRIYIRYLTPGAPTGTPATRFLTVGTYPGLNAYGALQTVAARPGSVKARTQSGALVVFAKASPRSVYFSFPAAKFQVEVYAPQPGRAKSLVLDGRIKRLG
jgi:hypothetical protein